MLEVGWGMVNPDMFQAVADTLEDVMQASVCHPSIIQAII
jgi:Ca2+-dependent lipid-binding protein